MPTFKDAKSEYLRLWSELEIEDDKASTIAAMARKVLSGKGVYQAVAAKTGVPWWFIGVLHARESSCDFSTHLHNGDTLTRQTTRVPAGRPKGKGPFSWQDSAIDALKMKGLDKITTWPIERVCFEAERYNGWGYRKPGMPNSPYLWAGSSHYTRGKYIADHEYSARAVDKQSGCMAVLKKLSEIDPSFALGPEAPKRTALETVRKSYSLPAMLNGLFVTIAGVFTTLFQYASDWAAFGLGIIPAMTTELQTTMGGGETIAGALNIPWPKISAAVAASCILVAFVREFNRKRAGQ